MPHGIASPPVAERNICRMQERHCFDSGSRLKTFHHGERKFFLKVLKNQSEVLLQLGTLRLVKSTVFVVGMTTPSLPLRPILHGCSCS